MHRLTKSTVIRGVILLPFLISNVIAAMLWFWLLDYQIGLVNEFIDCIGLNRIAFFGDETLGDPDHRAGQRLAAHGLHRAAGLRRPADDPRLRVRGGRGRRQHRVASFWRITLPLLRPILALVLVITVTGSFQVFDTVAVTTRGGPVNATRVMQYYIYQKAFAARPVRLRQRDLGDLVHHPRDRRPGSAQAADGRRVGPGLRGD